MYMTYSPAVRKTDFVKWCFDQQINTKKTVPLWTAKWKGLSYKLMDVLCVHSKVFFLNVSCLQHVSIYLFINYFCTCVLF